MTKLDCRSTLKVLVTERLEQRVVFDGAASFADWGMGNGMVSLTAETAYVSQLDSLIAIRTTPDMSSVDDNAASSELRLQLDGFPIAQKLVDTRLFLVMNLPDGTGAVEEYDVSDMLSPQRISRVDLPGIVHAADFFDDVLVLQTMDRELLPKMTSALYVTGDIDSVDLSELDESVQSWTDDHSGVLPPTTIQILALDHLSQGLIASQPFPSTIENVFIVGNELFAVTSNAFTPASESVETERKRGDFNAVTQPPFAPPQQTKLEHFHLDMQSGTLTFEETFAFDGMIMANDRWQSDSTEGLALLVQSWMGMPSASGVFSIEKFSLDAMGDVDHEQIPVTLPLGDNWVSSFEFSDGRGVLGSPQGLTLVDATANVPIVSTSLTYAKQFSAWAQLDNNIYLRIANKIDLGDGSIVGRSVRLDVLDVSDFSHPKTSVSRTFSDSDIFLDDWTWSVFESRVLKQAEGKYLLVIPTSSMIEEAYGADPATEGDLISIEPISLPLFSDSRVRLVSLSVLQESPVGIDLVGEFTIPGPVIAARLDEDVLTAMGYGEMVVVNLAHEPLTPIRITQQEPMVVDAPVDEVEMSIDTMTHNLSNPTDTNSDGLTNQLDVLLLINEINVRGSYALTSSSEINKSALVDVNGDQWLTHLDVLVIINWINRVNATEFRGEAEAEYDGVAQVSQSALRLPAVAMRAGAQLSAARTKSIDDTFASLSIDWDLGNDDLSWFQPSFAKLGTRSSALRFRLVRN
ncbi:MAG: dockerin type I domain-containing protein [Planctomycetota bacterium]|nr:dockerin type I domain-containing protein [Planctomycetota bacterium]